MSCPRMHIDVVKTTEHYVSAIMDCFVQIHAIRNTETRARKRIWHKH